MKGIDAIEERSSDLASNPAATPQERADAILAVLHKEPGRGLSEVAKLVWETKQPGASDECKKALAMLQGLVAQSQDHLVGYLSELKAKLRDKRPLDLH